MGQKLLLGCNKVGPYLYKTEETTYPAYPIGYHTDKDLKVKLSNTNELANLNGKIIAECDFEIEKIKYYSWIDEDNEKDYTYSCKTTDSNGVLELLKHSCLSFDELDNYLKGQNGYAIHIKNLHIFNEPRELEGYATWDWVEYSSGPVYAIPIKPLTRLTRMTRVMSLKYDDDDYAISLNPVEMCRVLNGEQDILVRKTVLKELRPNA